MLSATVKRIDIDLDWPDADSAIHIIDPDKGVNLKVPFFEKGIPAETVKFHGVSCYTAGPLVGYGYGHVGTSAIANPDTQEIVEFKFNPEHEIIYRGPFGSNPWGITYFNGQHQIGFKSVFDIGHSTFNFEHKAAFASALASGDPAEISAKLANFYYQGFVSYEAFKNASKLSREGLIERFFPARGLDIHPISDSDLVWHVPDAGEVTGWDGFNKELELLASIRAAIITSRSEQPLPPSGKTGINLSGEAKKGVVL